MVSSISMSVVVAGTAIATRITMGITVHAISAKVLWWNCAGRAPAAFRWRTIEMNMTPKTTTPIATQIQRMSMWRS